MEQIAATGHVTKGALYNHFPVKEAVRAHWLHLEPATKLAMLQDQLKTRPGFAEGALHVLDHSDNWCKTHPDYLAPYLRFRFLGIGKKPWPSRDSEQLSDNLDWLIRRGQMSGEIRDDLDPIRLGIAFHHLHLGAMLRWLTNPCLKLRKEFAAAVELFLHGAAVPAKASPKTSLKPKKRTHEVRRGDVWHRGRCAPACGAVPWLGGPATRRDCLPTAPRSGAPRRSACRLLR
jgi:AcrR family transcriptional regulator